MEEAMLLRLRLIHDKLLVDLGSIPGSVDVSNYVQAQIAHSKLDATVKRFHNDLLDYFRVTSTPTSEEICLMSGRQLEAEEALAELQVKLNQHTAKEKPKEKPEEPTSSCRLPKLQLPVFKGGVLDWFEFWDGFKSNIDSKNMPDVDKLSYLKASVSGDAKKAIEGLSTVNNNYKIAISILKERFGKTSHLIDAHYATLNNIKTASATATDCRNTYNEIERNLKILESLGENINHNHLRFMLMEKFPTDMIYEIKLRVNDESIQALRDQMNRIISAKEDAERISGKKRPLEEGTSTVETLHVQTKRARFTNRTPKPRTYENPSRKFSPAERQKPSTNRRRFWTCIFCDGDHFNDRCPKYSTSKERQDQLLKQMRCSLCFRTDHKSENCTYWKPCFLCKSKERDAKHNRALCPSNFRKEPEEKTTS